MQSAPQSSGVGLADRTAPRQHRARRVVSTTKATPAPRQIATVIAEDTARDPPTSKQLGGSQSDSWNNVLANQTINALWLNKSDEQARDRQLSAAVAGLIGIGPKDELEGMIAAQLIAAHSAAMECHRRAMIADQSFEVRRENLSLANKLSRTYAMLLETLDHHRGKGQQKVTVEHVHVHSGGQAIVGNVARPGGGGARKAEGQPHALGYAPCTQMRCENPPREPVPVAHHAEWQVPHARG
jgi:hypothetical protein